MFVVCVNMPGCLPEMEPYALDSFDSAKRALIDEMLRDADAAGESGDESLAEDLTHTAEDLNLDNGPEVCYVVGPLAYSIVVGEVETDEDEDEAPEVSCEIHEGRPHATASFACEVYSGEISAS